MGKEKKIKSTKVPKEKKKKGSSKTLPQTKSGSQIALPGMSGTPTSGGTVASLQRTGSKIGGSSGINWARLDEARRESAKLNRGPNLFTKPADGSSGDHSKIYNALNPQKLWYETAKEKAEAKDDDNIMVVQVRGGDARTVLDADKYTQLRDDQGNLLEQEDDDEDFEDDDVDESNLADFDPQVQKELQAKREQRDRESEQHRIELQKKAQEAAAEKQKKLDVELAKIARKEMSQKKKDEITSKDVEKIQKKLDKELEFDFGFGE
eukprot:m.167275 g.167275  ORF g.167275 m.167275 type:complete len:265 (+) comp18192_c0_seq1:420-1214(+)